MTLATPSLQTDRLDLVNAILGRAFGLSGGLLRPNQRIAELTPAERRQLLEAVQRRYPVARDPKDGQLRVAHQPAILRGTSTDPLAQLQLDEVARIREALKGPFALVRGGLCHPQHCPGKLIEDVDVIELRFGDLVEAIMDEAPDGFIALLAAEISNGLRALADLVQAADGGVEIATAAVVLRRQADWLSAAAQPAGALQGADAGLAFALPDLGDCVRCIEEAVESIRRLARELGLTDCDLEQLTAKPTLSSGDGKTSELIQIDLDSGLDAILRGWRLIAELIARGLVDPATIAAEAGRAQAIAQAFAALLPDGIGNAFGLDQPTAERFRGQLRRLARRAADCIPRMAKADATVKAPPPAEAAPPAAEPAAPAMAKGKRGDSPGKAGRAPIDDLKDIQ
jgi:hypothetical protein